MDDKKSLSRTFWVFVFFLWAATLTFLSVSKGPSLPRSPWISFFWNFAHVPAYGLLGPLAFLALPRKEGRLDSRPTRIGISWLAAMFVGGGNELLQGLTSYRSASWWDFLSDAAGAGLFLAWILFWRKRAFRFSTILLLFLAGPLLCAVPAYMDTFVSK